MTSILKKLSKKFERKTKKDRKGSFYKISGKKFNIGFTKTA